MSELLAYQESLLERLRAVLALIDLEQVTSGSGLRVDERAVELTLQPRGERVPSLHVFAASDHCTVGIAEGEVLEWRGTPDRAKGLVDHVVRLVRKYVSGVTVVEHYNRRDRLIGAEYFYGPDEEPSLVCQVGRVTRPFVPPRAVQRSVKRRFRFLREGAAAEQGDEADER